MSPVRKFVAALCVIVLLAGIVLLLWPAVHGYLQQQVIVRGLIDWRSLYNESRLLLRNYRPTEPEIEETELVYPELYAAIQAYNEEILANHQVNFNSRTAYATTVIDVTEFGVDDGPFGSIEIPKIDIKMPLYLGASDDNLAKGFAHMGYTSLPIGGENTNCVVAAHRGWGSAPYMRDVHLVEIGDSVFVETYWGVLEYKVSEIKVISPSEIEQLLIQPGKDMLTIFTCTPYGVGTHRHILYCERYVAEPTSATAESRTSFVMIEPEPTKSTLPAGN